jgi:hypothetical protein
MTFQDALNACSASIITLLKGAKIALECSTFKSDAAHCTREARKCCSESQISSGKFRTLQELQRSEWPISHQYATRSALERELYATNP